MKTRGFIATMILASSVVISGARIAHFALQPTLDAVVPFILGMFLQAFGVIALFRSRNMLVGAAFCLVSTFAAGGAWFWSGGGMG